MGFFGYYCDICGRKVQRCIKVSDSRTIVHYYNICLDCDQKYQIASGGKTNLPISKKVVIDTINSSKAADNGVFEIKMRCNVCGNVFCYTKEDLARNQRIADEVRHYRKTALVNSFGPSLFATTHDTDKADQLQSMIVDYSKCPKCNSSNITAVSDEEAKELAESGKCSDSSSPSTIDELKKYKELLDSGVITQEEFDAKKKQLLGL